MMKVKTAIGIALAAVLAGGWWWFQAPSRVVPVAETTKVEVSPASQASTRPAPAHPVTMRPVPLAPSNSVVRNPPLPASEETLVPVIINVDANYRDRFKAVRALSGHLNEFEWKQLRAFLLKPHSSDKGQLGQVLKNEVMDHLCALDPPPSDLGNVLVAIFRDRSQDDVIRDYAVQHLSAYYMRISQRTDAAESLRLVEGVLWEASAEPLGSVGGTAVLALKRLAEHFPTIDRRQLSATALRMARSQIAGELTRITAYQVCAELDEQEALPVVIRAAETGESIPVRLSAIAALGKLGGTEQINFLKQIIEGDQERLKPAAQHALIQIDSRREKAGSR